MRSAVLAAPLLLAGGLLLAGCSAGPGTKKAVDPADLDPTRVTLHVDGMV